MNMEGQNNKYDLLGSVSKLATSKLEMNVTLKTLLRLGIRDVPDQKEYLKILEKGIQLNNESDNVNQFRQKIKQLKSQMLEK